MKGHQASAGVVGAALWFGFASVVFAQGALPHETGFQPNRDYLSLLPWESIDTGSNNIILTFTDLALPGNGGRELRFDRAFTNQLPDDAEPHWRFGIAGVPMRVVERPLPTRPLPPGNVAAERATTPYFWMLDGSRMETTYAQPPDHANPLTLIVVRTARFWVYDRVARTLRIPDGTFAQYDAEGYLIKIWGAFHADHTNVVTFTWDDDKLDVVQSLGNGQSRTVQFLFAGDRQRPVSMTYDDRTWTYEYGAAGEVTRVSLPGGSRWEYEYSTDPFEEGKIARVSTPQEGVVEYEYADREFYEPGLGALRAFNVLVSRRTFDRDTLSGEWRFEHLASSVDAVDKTDITLPSGTRVSFVYGAASDSNVIAGHWQLRSRIVWAPDGSIAEEEERTYTGVQLRVARAAEPWYVPRLTRRTVSRHGQTYTTEYAYSSTASPHFHEYHRPTAVTERGPAGSVERRTTFTYSHLLEPSLLALPSTESTTVQGMTASRLFTYNTATGFRESETRYGIATTFAPDAFGNVATARKANGKTTTFTYSWGVLKDTVTPGTTVERTINPDGTVQSERIAGRLTEYGYDDPFRRVTRIQPPGSSNAVAFVYDDRRGTVEKRRGTSSVTTTRDGFGRVVETIDSAGIRTRTEYDAEGRQTYQSSPFTTADVGTEFTYDALGRLTSETNTDGTVRTRVFDDAANSVTVRDEEGRATVFQYRGFGHPDDVRLLGVVDANGQEWTYSYDAIGNLSEVITPTGHTRSWLRNTSGLVTRETHPETGSVSYAYDAAGVLKRKVDAKGTEFVYQHDGSDRVVRITAGGRVATIAYEPGSDLRVSMRNDSVSTTFDYDDAGRLGHRRDILGGYVFDSRYTYDGNDHVIEVTYPTGRVVGYERADSEGRLTRIFETAAGRDYAFGVSYHPSGALAAYTAGNTVPTLFGYHSTRYWVESITSGPLQLTYRTYDRSGNVVALDDARGPAWRQLFAYDPLTRVDTAIGPYGSVSYSYDPHGNRRTNGGSTYVTEAATLRLIAQNDQPIGYDANGNLTSKGGTAFTYTPENWVASATGGGGAATYAYDADGWRVRKASSGRTTFYLRGPSGELLTEWHITGGSARARDYVYAGSRLLSAIDKPVRSTTCGGESIPDGSPVALTIAPGATGTVTFEGSACRRVSAVINTSTLTNCSVFYNRFQILNPDGTTLASSSAVCAGSIVGPVELPTSGTYTVVVDPYGTNTGQVTVAVHDVVDVTGSLTLGQAVNVVLDTPGQRGMWTFMGTLNQRVSAVLHTSTFSNCLVYHAFKIVSGAGPNGPVIGTIGSLCAGAIVEPLTLPASGVYTLVVDPAGSLTGQAAVAAYDVVDVTGPLAFAQPVVGPLMTPGQRGVWTFTGRRNQRVSSAILSSTVTTCNVFYHTLTIVAGPSAAGPVVGSTTGACQGTMLDPVTLPADGLYTVVFDPWGSSVGHVTVAAYEVVDVSGETSVNGPAVSAALMAPGQRAFWTFSGIGGQNVRAAISVSTVPQCLIYNSFRIVSGSGPDGPVIGSSWNMCPGAIIGPFSLPGTGIYTLVVDPGGPSTGNITARVIDPVVLVNDTGPPSSLSVAPGATVAVRIVGAPGNARDWVSLSAAGSGNSSYLAWQYVPLSGTMSFKMPSTGGTYEFRLFLNNGYNRLATSATVTVR